MRYDYQSIERIPTLNGESVLGFVPQCVTSDNKLYGIVRGLNETDTLVVSSDNGQTITQLVAMPSGSGRVAAIYPIDANTLLISTMIGRIYKCISPFSEVTLVLTYTTLYTFAWHWSFASHGNLVFCSEYGWKSSSNNARRLYKSTDAGDTWVEVYQIPAVTGTHIHKLLLDPATDILYLTNGDYPANSSLRKLLPPNYDAATTLNNIQPTDGIMFNDFILWCQDNNTYGVYKQNKSDDTFSIVLNLETLYSQYADTAYSMTMDSNGVVYFATHPDVTITKSCVIFKSVAPYTSWELIAIVPSGGLRCGLYDFSGVINDEIMGIIEYKNYNKIPFVLRKWQNCLRS